MEAYAPAQRRPRPSWQCTHHGLGSLPLCRLDALPTPVPRELSGVGGLSYPHNPLTGAIGHPSDQQWDRHIHTWRSLGASW